jgi:L-rhamnose mutarotase
MKWYGMTIRIRPGSEEAYRKYHMSVWPEVLEMIRVSDIRNYSIFLKDDRLNSYFEYYGNDFESGMPKMAAHPKTKGWWAVVGPMQEPLTTRKSGEWWAEMDEIFHVD